MLHPYRGGVYGGESGDRGAGVGRGGHGELLAEIGEKKGFLVSLEQRSRIQGKGAVPWLVGIRFAHAEQDHSTRASSHTVDHSRLGAVGRLV